MASKLPSDIVKPSPPPRPRDAEPLRFCMVTTFYPPYHFGGDAVFVYRLSEALAELGHHVDVVHSIDAYHLQHAAEPDIAFTHHPNVTVHGLRTRRPTLAALTAQQSGRPAFYARTLRALLDGPPHGRRAAPRYDVIHYHNVSLMGGPGILSLGSAVKLYTAHEYWLICPMHVLFRMGQEACAKPSCLACTLRHHRPPQWWRYGGLMRDRLRHVDRILTPSQFALRKHREAGLSQPMEVLPYFVPAPASVPAEPPADLPERPFFLHVGRLELLKGGLELIEVFRDYRAADLVIVGDGSLAPQLRRRAADLPHVRFLGSLHPSRLSDYYARALAVLVPSLCFETFGLTAAEGMSHGTPVIARRIGALTEVVEESGGGLTFNSDQEWVAAMERIRTNPALRAALGDKGREAWREHWSRQAHLRRYLALVRTLVAQRRAAAGQPAGAGSVAEEHG